MPSSGCLKHCNILSLVFPQISNDTTDTYSVFMNDFGSVLGEENLGWQPPQEGAVSEGRKRYRRNTKQTLN